MQDDILSYEERLLLENFRCLSDKGQEVLLDLSERYQKILGRDIIYFPEQNHVL